MGNRGDGAVDVELRVPPGIAAVAMASPISSSRLACKALDHVRSASPRWAKVISRSEGEPARAYSSAAAKSIPPVPVRARGSSVAGLTSVASAPCPSTQRPWT